MSNYVDLSMLSNLWNLELWNVNRSLFRFPSLNTARFFFFLSAQFLLFLESRRKMWTRNTCGQSAALIEIRSPSQGELCNKKETLFPNKMAQLQRQIRPITAYTKWCTSGGSTCSSGPGWTSCHATMFKVLVRPVWTSRPIHEWHKREWQSHRRVLTWFPSSWYRRSMLVISLLLLLHSCRDIVCCL